MPQRLDIYLALECAKLAELTPITRAQIKGLIERGAVTLDGVKIKKGGIEISKGAKISLMLAPPMASLKPYEFALDVVYEDSDVIVINKPAGIAMHPGAGNRDKTVANALWFRLGAELNKSFPNGERPGIVHRLDKDTTGLVVVAKNLLAHQTLVEQFKSRETKRVYQALVFTTPRGGSLVRDNESGTIEGAIGREPNHRTRMAVVASGGKAARTHFKVIERMDYGTLLELSLDSGRTHQIRVHLNSVGSPVIGDKLYGDFSGLPRPLKLAAQRFGRQALHAFRLSFVHPKSGQITTFETPAPPDFQALLAVFRG